MSYPPQQPGQPGPYGQPPWMDQGFPMGPPPAKPRTGLIAALVTVAVLVVVGGGVGAYLLLSKDGGGDTAAPDGTDPRAVAEEFADRYEVAVNSSIDQVAVEDFEPLLCTSDYQRFSRELDRAQTWESSTSRQPPRSAADKVTVTVEDLRVNGDEGNFTLTHKRADGRSGGRDRGLDLVRDGTSWQVCGVYRDTETGSGPTASRKKLPLPSVVRPSS